MKIETKLSQLLNERGLTQTDLFNMIKDSGNKVIGRDRISKMASGKLTNFNIETAKIISSVLDVKIDDIVD
jgi:DNA-binding Xre family transcriptional regulator